ncbi:PREDICTED: zinc finger protein ZIC 5-like [Lipotes vexillifer]|uniref:Zinc finger protein ZIC 5-like n=1 Tax=Lipotes vexillifer TaxID=118797 RepID=A0A340WMU1_LIPVE|nr:PREDICTED: zinc finger protein ZIC 5-like [Lipotes vexillifer]
MTDLETAALKEEFLTQSSREEGCTTLHGAHEERQGLSAGRGPEARAPALLSSSLEIRMLPAQEVHSVNHRGTSRRTSPRREHHSPLPAAPRGLREDRLHAWTGALMGNTGRLGAASAARAAAEPPASGQRYRPGRALAQDGPLSAHRCITFGPHPRPPPAAPPPAPPYRPAPGYSPGHPRPPPAPFRPRLLRREQNPRPAGPGCAHARACVLRTEAARLAARAPRLRLRPALRRVVFHRPGSRPPLPRPGPGSPAAVEGRAGTLKPRLLRGLRRKLLVPPSQVDDLRSGPLVPALFTCRRTWELAQVRRRVGPGHGACGAQWQWQGAAGRRSLPPGRAGAAAGPTRCPGHVAPETPGCPPPLTAGGQLRGRRALAARVPAETRVSSCCKYRPPPLSRGADLLFSLDWGGGRRGAGRGREEESLTLGRGAAGGEPAPRVCCPRGRRSRPGRSASAALGWKQVLSQDIKTGLHCPLVLTLLQLPLGAQLSPRRAKS